MKQNSKFTD